MKFLLLFLTLLLTGTVNKPTGNVPLHEKTETRTPDYSTEKGYFDNVRTEPVVTWVFEEGTFVPVAKLTEKEQYSIVTNYLGTPEAMYREDGETVWTCELNSYGKVRNWQGEVKTDCPFRFQGQYEDAETGLYYNRFRYYDPSIGNYISQDPIGLAGGNPTLYGYVHDPNSWIDQLGLECGKKVKIGDEIAPNSKVRRIKEGTNGKTIIIGRNMDDRVIPSAKNLGAEYWDGFDKTLSKYDLSS